MLNKIIYLIVTVFGIGKIKYAPGTFGSLAAIPLMLFILQLAVRFDFYIELNSHSSQVNSIITIILSLTTVSFLLFIIGIYASNCYLEKIKLENSPNLTSKKLNDPSEIVIDELAGQMLTFSLCFMSLGIVANSNLVKYIGPNYLDIITLIIMPFMLFRLFDIAKPWPINLVDEKIKGGLGVMLDDILAAIFATLLHYAIIFILIDIL